jgi:hypothetical protein
MLNLIKKAKEEEDKKVVKKTTEVGKSGLPVGKPLTINTGNKPISTDSKDTDIVEEAELNVDPNSTHRIIERKHKDGKYSKVFTDRKTGSTYGGEDKYDAPNLNGTLDDKKYKRTALSKNWMDEYRNKPSTVIVSNDDSKKPDAQKLSLSTMAKNK